MALKENFTTEALPSDINLTSFAPKKELNPKFWIHGKLNSRIRLKLLDLADNFMDSISMNWVEPIDIVFTGSLANYNWSKYSDIDLHIIIDYNNVYKDKNILLDFFKAKKDEWNNDHKQLTIYGFPVEIFVQDVEEFNVSSGIYSLEKDEWVKEPIILSDSINNKDEIKRISAMIITKVDDLEEKINGTDDEHKLKKYNQTLTRIIKRLKEVRRDGLKGVGEMSTGNIIYKVIRRSGYLKKLFDLKNFSYDKINTLP